MLEIRKNTFLKNYENSFFRDFSRNLSRAFKEKNFSGILIGNPVCEVDERLQIDALLITPDVICIIDFKNIEGKINLPDEDNFADGLWTWEDSNPIKGGGSINPYHQLRYQKGKFINVFDKYIKSQIAQGDYFDPFHTVRVVCFQERIELNGKIPKKEEQNFFIFHKENYLEGILDIVDTTDEKVSLKEERSLDAFRNIFRANLYDPDGKASEDLTREIVSESLKLNYEILYNDQKEALAKIESFLKNPEQQIFILQGTVNSGKSFLIPFIEELAYRSGIPDTQIFAASGRIAKNLLVSTGLENINSIYSYIYGGGKITTEEEIEDRNEQEINDKEEKEASDDLSIEIIPLKKCDNADNALFIVDEAHLVSDSYYKSLDLQFGTGQLLKDFLTFVEIGNKKRKVIFIGDYYQLQIGGPVKSALNPAYLQEKYTVKTESFSLTDKENYSPINAEALKCVNAIRSRVFKLSFSESANLQFVKQENFLTYASNLITNKIDGHILCFGNKDAQKVNHWIKTEIIKNGADIGIGDVVLLNNNISAKDKNDPFAPQKVYNGQFAEVIDVGEKLFSKKCEVKGNLINLTFREISLGMKESGRRINILSFENYRLSPKGELSENEIIAFKIILNQILSEAKKKSPFEKSDEYLEAINSKSYQLLQNEINDLENKLKLGEKLKTKLAETKRMQGKLLTYAKRKYNNKIRVSLQNDPSSEYYKFKNAAFLRFG